MNTEADKMIIVEKHIDMMMETLQLLDEKALIEVVELKDKPKKKDTRVRNRKEYMSRYYETHKDDLLERSKKRYTPKEKKKIE